MSVVFYRSAMCNPIYFRQHKKPSASKLVSRSAFPQKLYSMCLLRNEPHYSEFTTALKCFTFVSAAQMWVSVPGSECAIGLCLWVRAAQGNGCLWHAERGFVTGISEDEQDLQMKAQVRHDPHFHVLPSEPQSSAALGVCKWNISCSICQICVGVGILYVFKCSM